MRKLLRVSLAPVVLAAVVILTVVPVAQSAKYSTTYYDIYYFNSTQYRFARGLAPYLGRAFGAAKTTIGYDARLGKMNIYFSYSSSAVGWMYAGFQRIYLSVPYFIKSVRSYDKWGSVVAHESAHVLFFNYTRAHKWNSGLLYYTTFLTESLSWYAGDYVYNHHRYTSSSAYSQIRAHLKYYAERTKKTLSWRDSGFYYRNGTSDSNLFNQNIWQLRAIGWYLTGGRLTNSSPNVKKLLYYMRRWTSGPGYGLGSYGSSRAIAYFENAFAYSYGRYANSSWSFTGSNNEAYKNRNYLYGTFWYYFYN